jgi:hypothetical protein
VRYLHIRRGQERVVDEHELTTIPDDAPRCSVCGYASVDHDLTLTSTHVACGGMKFGGAPAPRPILTTEN